MRMPSRAISASSSPAGSARSTSTTRKVPGEDVRGGMANPTYQSSIPAVTLAWEGRRWPRGAGHEAAAPTTRVEQVGGGEVRLIHGDVLDVARAVGERVALVYIDPPFAS